MPDANVVETSPAANKGTPGSADEGSGDGGGRGSPSLPSEDAILKQVMSNLGITEEALKEKVLEHFDIESFADVAGLTDADAMLPMLKAPLMCIGVSSQNAKEFHSFRWRWMPRERSDD